MARIKVKLSSWAVVTLAAVLACAAVVVSWGVAPLSGGRIPPGKVESLMAVHVVAYAHDTPPTVAPTRIGQIAQTADGAVYESVRDGATLAWRLVSPGLTVGNVRGVVQAETLAATLTDGGNTLTANANGAFNAQSYGGIATWAANDRLILAGQSTGTQNGVWFLADVGAAGSPWVLTRALDARTAQNLSRTRVFFVEDGDAAGELWANATEGATDPVPGTDNLVFARVSSMTPQTVSAAVVMGGDSFVVRVTVNAPGAGAQDVIIFGASPNENPLRFELVFTNANIQTAGGAGTSAQVRDAAGGAGNALSGPVSTAAVGKVAEGAGGGVVANTAVAVNGSLYLRLSDGTVVGTFYLHCRRL